MPAAINDLIEIAEAGQGEEMLRNVVLDPCGGAEGVERIAREIALLNGLRVLDDLPAVACQIGAVNDENSYRAAT